MLRNARICFKISQRIQISDFDQIPSLKMALSMTWVKAFRRRRNNSPSSLKFLCEFLSLSNISDRKRAMRKISRKLSSHCTQRHEIVLSHWRRTSAIPEFRITMKYSIVCHSCWKSSRRVWMLLENSWEDYWNLPKSGSRNDFVITKT